MKGGADRPQGAVEAKSPPQIDGRKNLKKASKKLNL